MYLLKRFVVTVCSGTRRVLSSFGFDGFDIGTNLCLFCTRSVFLLVRRERGPIILVADEEMVDDEKNVEIRGRSVGKNVDST